MVAVLFQLMLSSVLFVISATLIDIVINILLYLFSVSFLEFHLNFFPFCSPVAIINITLLFSVSVLYRCLIYSNCREKSSVTSSVMLTQSCRRRQTTSSKHLADIGFQSLSFVAYSDGKTKARNKALRSIDVALKSVAPRISLQLLLVP